MQNSNKNTGKTKEIVSTICCYIPQIVLMKIYRENDLLYYERAPKTIGNPVIHASLMAED